MSSFIINMSLDFIKNYSNYSNKDLNKIKYGVEGIYLTVTKILIIILLGIIFRYLSIVILTVLFFNVLRFFAFGLHAKKSWHCLILSILSFNVLPYILNYLTINNTLITIIGFISLISFLFFAPSDTEKRPLKNRKKRIIRKIISVFVGIIFIIVSFYISYLRVPILCSLLIESFMINPVCYKLLGLKYKNYKK